MPKVITIVGARPNFVKAAVVSAAFKEHGSFEELILHTGQHYDYEMSGLFFEELGIPKPAIHLDIGSGPHGQQTGRMMEKIESVVARDKPDWLIVHGDTNSTLAGALVAAKLHVPCAHVEAGARSYNRRMPEEVNRVVIDHVADMLFANTQVCIQNLRAEGITGERCLFVGDVMYDAALKFAPFALEKSVILKSENLSSGSYVLATIHRAENTDNPHRLEVIIRALNEVAATLPVLLPTHPRTRKLLSERGFRTQPNLRLLPPIGYLDMLALERSAAIIATDSGGVQREAFFHRVPCITLRDETEMVEIVTLDWLKVVPPLDHEIIVDAILGWRGHRGRDGAPYGDGHASHHIARALAGTKP
jgi:UDP-GlcNAc3NAcA epimerase